MNKIYITLVPRKDGKVYGMAITDSGQILVETLSENQYWAKFDLGIDSEKSHDVYQAHYPKGYGLVLIENYESSQTLKDIFLRLRDRLMPATA